MNHTHFEGPITEEQKERSQEKWRVADAAEPGASLDAAHGRLTRWSPSIVSSELAVFTGPEEDDSSLRHAIREGWA